MKYKIKKVINKKKMDVPVKIMDNELSLFKDRLDNLFHHVLENNLTIESLKFEIHVKENPDDNQVVYEDQLIIDFINYNRSRKYTIRDMIIILNHIYDYHDNYPLNINGDFNIIDYLDNLLMLVFKIQSLESAINNKNIFTELSNHSKVGIINDFLYVVDIKYHLECSYVDETMTEMQVKIYKGFIKEKK